MRYRRARQNGGTYFFTLVTYKRRKMLCEPENIELLRAAFKYVMDRHPFTINAHIILPDHLHFIWTLPDEDRDFSTRWQLIKSYFTRNCNAHYKTELSKSRQKKKEQAIWQLRFWEHQIRDEQDMKHHIEYIHFNPETTKDWAHSSFQKYVRAGLYDQDWGMGEPIKFEGDIGNE